MRDFLSYRAVARILRWHNRIDLFILIFCPPNSFMAGLVANNLGWKCHLCVVPCAEIRRLRCGDFEPGGFLEERRKRLRQGVRLGIQAGSCYSSLRLLVDPLQRMIDVAVASSLTQLHFVAGKPPRIYICVQEDNFPLLLVKQSVHVYVGPVLCSHLESLSP